MGRRKNSKWLPLQEQKLLRQLKEKQKAQNIVNWEIISKQINQRFQNSKTSKQCRQRYINYLKFDPNQEQSQIWTTEEIMNLYKLYLQHGSSWTKICSGLKNKSENQTKNKFHTLIRRGAKNLENAYHRQKFNATKKKRIPSQMLCIIIDLASKIRKKINSTCLIVNENCMILKLQNKILQYCFEIYTFTDEEIAELMRFLRQINMKLRSFGFFKVKNRKHFHLSDNCFLSICSLDQMVKIQQVKLEPIQNFVDKKYVQGRDYVCFQNNMTSKAPQMSDIVKTEAYPSIHFFQKLEEIDPRYTFPILNHFSF